MAPGYKFFSAYTYSFYSLLFNICLLVINYGIGKKTFRSLKITRSILKRLFFVYFIRCTQLLGYDTLKKHKNQNNPNKIIHKNYPLTQPFTQFLPHPTPPPQIPNPTFNSHPLLLFYYLPPLFSSFHLSKSLPTTSLHILLPLTYTKNPPNTPSQTHLLSPFTTPSAKKIASLETREGTRPKENLLMPLLNQYLDSLPHNHNFAYPCSLSTKIDLSKYVLS